MYNLKLFLGLQIDPSFESSAKKTNPYLASLLTGGGDYLCEVDHNQSRYLGKFTPQSPTLDQLDSLEAHVLSLLKKLVPDYTLGPNSIVLLSINNE